MEEDEAEKIRIVVFSNAVVDPGTMVVEPLDTFVAVGAMKATRCSNQAALRAHLCCIHRPQDCHEVHGRIRFEETRIFAPNNYPQEDTYDVQGLAGVEDPILRTLANHRLVVFAYNGIRGELQQSHGADHEHDIEY